MEIVAKVEGTEHFHTLSRFGDRRQDRPQSQNFSKTLGSNCIQEGRPIDHQVKRRTQKTLTFFL